MSCGNGASYACNLSLGLNWWYSRLICKLFRISMLKADFCNIFIHFILVNKWDFIYWYILEINCLSVAILIWYFDLVQKRNRLLNVHCIYVYCLYLMLQLNSESDTPDYLRWWCVSYARMNQLILSYFKIVLIARLWIFETDCGIP